MSFADTLPSAGIRSSRLSPCSKTVLSILPEGSFAVASMLKTLPSWVKLPWITTSASEGAATGTIASEAMREVAEVDVPKTEEKVATVEEKVATVEEKPAPIDPAVAEAAKSGPPATTEKPAAASDPEASLSASAFDK